MNLAATLTLDNAGFTKPAQAAARETLALTVAAKEMGTAVAAAAKQADAPMRSLRLQMKALAQDPAQVATGSVRGKLSGLLAEQARIGARAQDVAEFGAYHQLRQAKLAAKAGLAAPGGGVGAALPGASEVATAGHFASITQMVGRAAGPLALAAVGWKAVTASIRGASNMEDATASFVTLLGSAGAAQSRMEELAKFADTTPFELPEIVQASRVLETLTKGALSTGAGLTMVGNVAAVTQQPIGDLAMWVGRLYDGLQSGRAVGEAMMRLQELGVMSGETRTKIEDLQESGKKGEAVWQVAAASFAKFSGEMERRSQTVSGKFSTMKDAWGALLREIGQPVNAIVIEPALSSATTQLNAFTSFLRASKEGWKDILDLHPGDFSPLRAKPKASPNQNMDDVLKSTFGGLDRMAGWQREINAAVAPLRAMNEERVLRDPFANDLTKEAAMNSRARRLADDALGARPDGPTSAFDTRAPAPLETVETALERVEAQIAFNDSIREEASLAEGAAMAMQKLVDTYAELLELKQNLDLMRKRNVDDALHDFFDPLDKQSTTMGGKKPAGRDQAPASDRLSRIGGFIGGGGPANDHARSTAANTARLVTQIQRLPTAITEAIMHGSFDGARAPLWG